MNLDCPGCQSRLKLDPAKLPPGATAAVCPKCRTKILLPGTSPTADISIQCTRCSSRLKVKVARLKQTPSRSKCPKCGNRVDLPAAPGARQAGAATRGVQAPPAAPPPGVDKSAMTRRLDAREMGVLMQGQGGPGGGGGVEAPIPVEEPPSESLEGSSADLGRLIDEKVEALGELGEVTPPPAPRPGEPSVEDLAIDLPAAGNLPLGSGGPPSAPDTAPPQAASPGAAPGREMPRRPGSSSGGRAAPTFASVMPARKPSSAGQGILASVLGGVVGGSVVAAGLILGGRAIPSEMLPPVPQPVADALFGPSLALLASMVLLAAVAGLLASIALPARGSAPGRGASIFRCAVAASLLGLLAGVGVSFLEGGTDLTARALPAASWTVALLLSGLLTGLIAKAFSSR